MHSQRVDESLREGEACRYPGASRLWSPTNACSVRTIDAPMFENNVYVECPKCVFCLLKMKFVECSGPDPPAARAALSGCVLVIPIGFGFVPVGLGADAAGVGIVRRRDDRVAPTHASRCACAHVLSRRRRRQAAAQAPFRIHMLPVETPRVHHAPRPPVCTMPRTPRGASTFALQHHASRRVLRDAHHVPDET